MEGFDLMNDIIFVLIAVCYVLVILITIFHLSTIFEDVNKKR